MFYLLVHGAWHGGWCWKRVATLINSTSHSVACPTLTGSGEKKNLMTADIDLDTHINDIVNLIVENNLTNIILVGHSYGGMVISGVANILPKRIAHLVYLDAFLPNNEQSLMDMLSSHVSSTINALIYKSENGLLIPPFPAEHFGITDKSDIDWVNTMLTPQPYKTFTQAIILNNNYLNTPKTYILCKQPSLGIFEQMAQTAKLAKMNYHELATGHDAMLTKPSELAQMLLTL